MPSSALHNTPAFNRASSAPRKGVSNLSSAAGSSSYTLTSAGVTLDTLGLASGDLVQIGGTPAGGFGVIEPGVPYVIEYVNPTGFRLRDPISNAILAAPTSASGGILYYGLADPTEILAPNIVSANSVRGGGPAPARGGYWD